MSSREMCAPIGMTAPLIGGEMDGTSLTLREYRPYVRTLAPRKQRILLAEPLDTCEYEPDRSETYRTEVFVVGDHEQWLLVHESLSMAEAAELLFASYGQKKEREAQVREEAKRQAAEAAMGTFARLCKWLSHDAWTRVAGTLHGNEN